MKLEEQSTATVSILEGRMTSGPLSGHYTYSDWTGTVYRGILADGLPHGPGELQKPSGESANGKFLFGDFWEGRVNWTLAGVKFEGEVKEGQIWKGRGLRRGEGVVETGQFCEGILDGQGERVEGDGKRSFGRFVQGKLWEGEGHLQIGTSTYNGQVSEGRPHGKGSLFGPEGTAEFLGTFKSGRGWEGSGRLTSGDFSESGTFRQGQLEGAGQRVGAGRTEIGRFESGRLNGLGAIVGPGNHLSVGRFIDGQLSEGKRVTDWRFECGKFENGVLHGEGVVKYIGCQKTEKGLFFDMPEEFHNWAEECLSGEDFNLALAAMDLSDSPSFLRGRFENGRLNGQGYATISGVASQGEFRDGLLHGPGRRTFPDGRVETGVFENGCLKVAPASTPVAPEIKTIKTIEFGNGLVFEGTSWPSGSGLLHYGEGFFQRGRFENAQLVDGSNRLEFTRSATLTLDFKGGVPTCLFRYVNHIYHMDLLVPGPTPLRINRLTYRNGHPIKAQLATDQVTQQGNFILPSASLFVGKLAQGTPNGEGVLHDRYGISRKGLFERGELSNGTYNWRQTLVEFERGEVVKATYPDKTCKFKLPTARILNNDGQITRETLISGSSRDGFPHGSVTSLTPSSYKRVAYRNGERFGLLQDCRPNDYLQVVHEGRKMVGPGYGLTDSHQLFWGVFTDNGCFQGFKTCGCQVETGTFVDWKLNGVGSVRSLGGLVEGVFEAGQLSRLNRVSDPDGKPVDAKLATGKEEGPCTVVKRNGTLLRANFEAGTPVGPFWSTTKFGMVTEGEARAGQLMQSRLIGPEGFEEPSTSDSRSGPSQAGVSQVPNESIKRQGSLATSVSLKGEDETCTSETSELINRA